MKSLLLSLTVLTTFSAFSQVPDSTLLLHHEPTLLLVFGNCYFSRTEYRINGQLKKEVQSDGNGFVRTLYYRKNKEVRSTIRYDKHSIRSMTPPCYNSQIIAHPK